MGVRHALPASFFSTLMTRFVFQSTSLVYLPAHGTGSGLPACLSLCPVLLCPFDRGMARGEGREVPWCSRSDHLVPFGPLPRSEAIARRAVSDIECNTLLQVLISQAYSDAARRHMTSSSYWS